MSKVNGSTLETEQQNSAVAHGKFNEVRMSRLARVIAIFVEPGKNHRPVPHMHPANRKNAGCGGWCRGRMWGTGMGFWGGWNPD